MRSVGLVLLAAGKSSRMQAPKQLLPFRGKPLVRHCAEIALVAYQSVIVVLGANALEVTAALDGMPVTLVHNQYWEQGMGTSIGAGVQRAAKDNLEGIVLSLADQPMVSADYLRGLSEAHKESGQPVVASRYAGTVGVPVFFAHSFFDQLLQLRPEQGCKTVILSNRDRALCVDCPEAEFDIDTPQDYEALCKVVPEPPK